MRGRVSALKFEKLIALVVIGALLATMVGLFALNDLEFSLFQKRQDVKLASRMDAPALVGTSGDSSDSRRR
jgi:hypothetical protein